MKNALLLVGGGLLGYGLWLFYKNRQSGCGCNGKDQVVYKMTETVQTIHPGNPMIERHDARPEVLFAPPVAIVDAGGAGATDGLTQNFCC